MNSRVIFIFFILNIFVAHPFFSQTKALNKRKEYFQKRMQLDSIRRIENNIKALDTTQLKKFKAYYAPNTIYAYYDVVRQFGVGYRHSFNPYFDLNIETGYIGAYGNIGGVGDFFLKKGFSINILPKFIVFSAKGLYMGPLITYQHLSYKNQWVEQFPGYSKYYTSYSARSDLKSNGFTFQYCLGTKHNFKYLSLETFVSVGLETNYNKRTWYEVNKPFKGHYDNITFPYSFKETDTEFIGTAGIKIGYNYTPKRILCRQYLDAYVTPRITQLNLGKLYRKKMITKQQIRDLARRKHNILLDLNKLYKKYYLNDKIMLKNCNSMIDSLNFFIKSTFPTE